MLKGLALLAKLFPKTIRHQLASLEAGEHKLDKGLMLLGWRPMSILSRFQFCHDLSPLHQSLKLFGKIDRSLKKKYPRISLALCKNGNLLCAILEK